jgi:hypothetical protein
MNALYHLHTRQRGTIAHSHLAADVVWIATRPEASVTQNLLYDEGNVLELSPRGESRPSMDSIIRAIIQTESSGRPHAVGKSRRGRPDADSAGYRTDGGGVMPRTCSIPISIGALIVVSI